MYELIAPFRPFRESKVHIAKDSCNLNPLCGRFLGFDFGIISVTGFEGDTPELYSVQEINKHDLICKVGLKSLLK